MRLNKFLADNTDLSRRKADNAIENGRVKINGSVAILGQAVNTDDIVILDGDIIAVKENSKNITLLLNKPVGYVCSKNGQGSKTVYDLVADDYKHLNIAGRLDKDSSGLVVLTSDGTLLNELTHPSSNKEKIYEVSINKDIAPPDRNSLLNGTDIGDERLSKFKFLKKLSGNTYEVVLEEGRNRQIRRAFEALGYTVNKLHRIQIGNYKIGSIKPKEVIIV